jgi:hypothetical protein
MAKPARNASSEAILRKAQGLKPESFLGLYGNKGEREGGGPYR